MTVHCWLNDTADVQALGAEAVAALLATAPQEVPEYLLRKSMGYGPEVISGETLRSLLQAGCRTPTRPVRVELARRAARSRGATGCPVDFDVAITQGGFVLGGLPFLSSAISGPGYLRCLYVDEDIRIF
mgnify:CR=1 FL=1